jgi:serpin B
MKTIVLTALVIAILTITACGPAAPAPDDDQTPEEPTPTPEPSGDRAPGEAVASDLERVSAPEVSDETMDELVAGNTAFALDLYQQLVETQGDQNLFYSPYSISLALAMTYAGARGETEQQMADALHYTLPQERLHPAFNALDQLLESRGEGAEGRDDKAFRLNIANAIWGQEGYPFLDPFLDKLAMNYGAGLRVLDFVQAAEKARVTINEWVSEETEGKIEELIAQGVITPMTRLVLTNAIYFNAAWSAPFQEERTRDGAFYLLDGSEVTVPMMRKTTSYGYAEGEGYQAVELLYDGQQLSMVIVVPESGEFEAFEGALDAERMSAIVDKLDRQEVALTMPKFEFDSGFGLNDALRAMGMEDAFSEAADFSGMTGTTELFISSVIHKAFVSVDEEGTEAAAATAVVMAAKAMPAEPVEVTVDRSFIFTIRDIETGAVLFVGRVLDPS